MPTGLGGYMRDSTGQRLDEVEVLTGNNLGRNFASDNVGILAYRYGLPEFEKFAGNPIIAPDTDEMPSIYWPWAIRVDGVIDDPIDVYYLYVSTDHAEADGFIGLYTAPHPEGPWTFYGQVYQDVAGGTESETPSVIWVPEVALFYMYYQQVNAPGSNASQTTLLATSPDGLTWTRYGIVIDIGDQAQWPASAHTGYFAPIRIAGKWYGFGLLAGGTAAAPRWALSYSEDGIHWQLDPRPLGYGAEYLEDGVERIEWNSTRVIEWRGQLLWIGVVSSFASGGVDRTGRYCVAPISPDLRTLLGPPRQIIQETQAWESHYYTFGSVLLDNDGTLYVYYRSGPVALDPGTGLPQTGVGVVKARVAL